MFRARAETREPARGPCAARTARPRDPAVRIVLAALATTLAICVLPAAPAAANPKYAALVVDATTGRTLFARHADARRYPASLTKIMTLYVVFEELKAGRLALDTELKVSAHAAARPPSKIGFKPGSTVRVEDAIKALVTKSANDVAVVVAENISGSEEAFARRMTQTARRLGMHSTTFRNASGLPDDRQVTTARDMARLGLAVQRDHPRYYGFFKLRSFTYRGKTYSNHNRLLGRVQGVDGIKTGFIRASGFNLVSSVRRDDRHIVAVVMGGRSGASRNAHMTELIAEYLPKAAPGAGSAPIFLAGRPIPVPEPKPYGRILAAVIERKMLPEETLRSDPDAIIDTFGVASIRRAAAPTPPRLRVEAPPAPVARGSAAAPSVAEAAAPDRGGAAPSPADDAPRKVKTIKIVAGPTGTRQAPASTAGPVAFAATQTDGAPEYGSADAPEAVRLDERDVATVPPGWHIQIAATTTEAEALGAIESARRRFPELLSDVNHATMRVETRTATLYRARFVGFRSRSEARDACERLVARGQACWAEAM